jgi:hypothetical protein
MTDAEKIAALESRVAEPERTLGEWDNSRIRLLNLIPKQEAIQVRLETMLDIGPEPAKRLQ